ncbi:bifunctional orotidine-5'-phosphate decarboxylase/orotate phosphoribosyltransferase [Cyanobium sp. NIES-981]|uniref:bifunctional orotidine-5'-phosphate decarboxylase/orotate phosphoribosyltransferase n=1 Tax=Cyanobium sp. NIES-981 TaxID=1851505 RepID=UPI0007DDA022|nr:bifunctional orotidine-5'-phosphate decarboxylase/orotate phosphoribosyltransferase [Cyanobium sp. NIES-981]SBO42763.1 Bifunctional enzyme PyrF/PyrE [Includes: Orotidine 5'-phosphate decarboxylase; Orotate phosphoribosyltransferase] [Cyanobium sp. NIES-981]
MGFFVRLTDAIADRQSLLVTGLDPNPEMLQSWVSRRGMAGRSFLSQARHWIKAVIEATAPHVCAYKPSLGFYQALGPVGLELLLEVRDLVPPDLPLIIDSKHGDLNSSSALAQYVFRELAADAVTLSPLAGQDIAAPFLLYPDKAVVITCHSSNEAARLIQHFPSEEEPLYLRIVQECLLWATPEQLLLEVGTSEPDILARVRREAPERFLILRSLWGVEEKLEAMLQAGLSSAGDGLLLPLPQNLLVEDDIAQRAEALKLQINATRAEWLDQRGAGVAERCDLWLPAPPPRPVLDRGPAGQPQLTPEVTASLNAMATATVPPPAPAAVALQESLLPTADALESLIVDLFDIGCLLFGDYVQASGAVFNYYIDLRQIISDPNLFHRVLHAYAGRMEELVFDRIAGIPYGSLPTATGLSLLLHKPLIYPRKEVKAHGARRLIEGDFEEGDLVVVVDDILITGGSVLEGIGKLESSGLQVQDVVVFLDHGGDHDRRAKERLAAAGYRCQAVLGIDAITRVLHGAGRLSDGQAALLLP